MMDFIRERAIYDGLALRLGKLPCGPWCVTGHPAVWLGWPDTDRWALVGCGAQARDVFDDDDVNEVELHALMLFGVPWARMDDHVAAGQLLTATGMADALWRELDCWPDETLSLMVRMRATDFGAVPELLALTRAYRADVGGSRGATV